MALARIDLELRADGPPVVTVNGSKLAGVVGLTVRHAPPSMPQLFVELAGEVALEGEGIVAADNAGDTAADVRAALLNLDPDRLDDQAAQLFGADGPDGKAITGPGQAFVAAILNALNDKGVAT